jgi:flagellar FliL protein
MDDEHTENDAAAAAPEPRKKGGLLKKLLLLSSAMLVLLAGGATYWVLGGAGASAREAHVKLEERGILPFETFLVNLSDPGGNRFLKVTLKLVVESDDAATHVAENPSLMSHARSAILELLTEQQAQPLVTAAGKQALKDAIRKRVGEVFTAQKVLDVLFDDFVVQF